MHSAKVRLAFGSAVLSLAPGDIASHALDTVNLVFAIRSAKDSDQVFVWTMDGTSLLGREIHRVKHLVTCVEGNHLSFHCGG